MNRNIMIEERKAQMRQVKEFIDLQNQVMRLALNS